MFKLLTLFVCVAVAIDARVVQEERPAHHLPSIPTKHYKDDRIVGGDIVSPAGKYPHQVALYRMTLGFKSFSCGGSLISPTHVVTAAHCVTGITNPANLHVRVGEQHLDMSSGDEQELPAKSLVYHENYSSADYSNDIAVIEVNGAFVLNLHVQPIALPAQSSEEDITGGNCVVTGWGSTFEGGSVARQLHEVTVPFVTDEACQAAYRDETIVGSMLCAGVQGKDACQGDSGGPILCDQGNKTLSGVVSWGYGCAREGSPGVYTQTAAFTDWVKAKAGL